MRFKRGQVTIFIILAIVIVAMAVLFIVFWKDIFPGRIPSEMNPIYKTFTSCIEEDAKVGIQLLESQGGYIYLPEYEEGSEYMPFSSQLDFVGSSIPYWYYVSANNVPKEQVPSINDMEKDLSKFIESKSRGCYFEDYYNQGYEITMEEPDAEIVINDKQITLNLKMDFSITKEDETYIVREHKIIIDSKLGSLYESALKVYEEEQENLFLENYTIDILRMYAPVDGVELTCSPKVWEANSIFNDLQEAIEINTMALKGSSNKNDYFEVEIEDIPSDHNVKFLNSKDWPYSFEVLPSEGNMLIAKPVGTQAGLGVLGFCYVTYHFVYNLKHPVLVQVMSGEETFQFPLAIVILGNKPRKPLEGSAIGGEFSELCDDKTSLVTVSIYGNDLKKIDGNVSYQCLGTSCLIGESEGGVLYDRFPECVNGYIYVRSEGYRDEKLMHTTTLDKTSVSIILNKIHEIGINLYVDRREYNGQASITFISDDFSKTIMYPEEKKVELSEGDYEIEVQIYKNSSLSLGETTMEQCIDVPRGGLGSLLGLTEKQCFNVDYPQQMISSALAGGGKQNYSISEYELQNSKTIYINAESMPNPSSFEQIQANYILFETKTLDVDLR